MCIRVRPYVIRTAVPRTLNLDFRERYDSTQGRDSNVTQKDPWDFWIFRIGTNGNLNADAVYKSYRYSANLSANRSTEKWKYGLLLNASKNQSSFKYDDGTGKVKFTVVNHDLAV